MFKTTVECIGVPEDAGPRAAADIEREFLEHRTWWAQPRCVYRHGRLSLSATSDFDRDGRALLDETASSPTLAHTERYASCPRSQINDSLRRSHRRRPCRAHGEADAGLTSTAATRPKWTGWWPASCPMQVHYFPPGMYDGTFRGARKIAEKWCDAVRALGSRCEAGASCCSLSPLCGERESQNDGAAAHEAVRPCGWPARPIPTAS
jgi:hypothetical protein